VLVFTHHGTCYPATLHDGKLDVNSLEQMLAFDSLNALNGTSPECDSSGLSCTVFGGDIKTQTQFRTGTPGACGVTFAIQELDCELVSIQHILILQELYCCFSFWTDLSVHVYTSYVPHKNVSESYHAGERFVEICFSHELEAADGKRVVVTKQIRPEVVLGPVAICRVLTATYCPSWSGACRVSVVVGTSCHASDMPVALYSLYMAPIGKFVLVQLGL